MDKIKYFNCFYQTVTLRASKYIKSNSRIYFIMKDANESGLQQIVGNHFADNDTKYLTLTVFSFSHLITISH